MSVSWKPGAGKRRSNLIRYQSTLFGLFRPERVAEIDPRKDTETKKKNVFDIQVKSGY